KDRDVAQPGSVLAWGARGRWFESSHPDVLKRYHCGISFFIGFVLQIALRVCLCSFFWVIPFSFLLLFYRIRIALSRLFIPLPLRNFFIRVFFPGIFMWFFFRCHIVRFNSINLR